MSDSDAFHAYTRTVKGDPEIQRPIVNPTKYSNWIITSYDDKSGLIVGEYPKKDGGSLDDLLARGVNVFVNLCTQQEKNKYGDYTDYVLKKNPDIKIVDFPFFSKKIPDPEKLYESAANIFNLIAVSEKLVYVHSTTGHGRSNVYAGYTLMFDPYINDSNRTIEILDMSLETREVRIKEKKKLESKAQYDIFKVFPEIHHRHMLQSKMRMKEDLRNKLAALHIETDPKDTLEMLHQKYMTSQHSA